MVKHNEKRFVFFSFFFLFCALAFYIDNNFDDLAWALIFVIYKYSTHVLVHKECLVRL